MNARLLISIPRHRSLYGHAVCVAIQGSTLDDGGLPDREPFPFLEGLEHPIAVDDLEHKAAVRAQHGQGRLDGLSIVPFIIEIAQAGEEVEDEVEVPALKWLSHVAQNESRPDAGTLCSLTGDGEHSLGEV